MNVTSSEQKLVYRSTIFRGLRPLEIDSILESAVPVSLEDEAFFFLEEEIAHKAYVLIKGKVKLIQVTADGQQVILGYLVPGRVYGIIAVLKKVTYPVSAQAVGSCRALSWDHDKLNKLMERYPRIALNALRIMAGQIREFQNSVKDLSTRRVEQRIARAVLRLARQSGQNTDEGILIDLPLSRQDLAEMTGTTLYTVSRFLKDWETRGFVKSGRQQVVICNPHGLVQIAEDLPNSGNEPKRSIKGGICDL